MDEQVPPELQTMLWSLAFDIAVVAVAVVALITTAKHIGKVLDQDSGACLDRPWVQVALEVAPLLLGPVIAVVPGLFDDFGFLLQAVFGLIAGFNSEKVYTLVKKRLPIAMVSKEGRNGDA